VQTGVKATASDAVAVGHEVSGVVRTLGPDLGRGLTVGTRVTLEAGKTRGRCAGRARRRPCTRMQFGARSGRIGLVMTGACGNGLVRATVDSGTGAPGAPPGGRTGFATLPGARAARRTPALAAVPDRCQAAIHAGQASRTR
jgi:hypothetical protein